MEKTIKPNKYSLAVKEIPTDSIDGEVLEAIKTIKESEKNMYFCLGIKSKDSADKMSKVLTGYPVFANIPTWEKMQKQKAKGQFKGLFGGKFNKVVILHDPTYVAPKKKATKKEAELVEAPKEA